jgi:hypothetical protein
MKNRLLCNLIVSVCVLTACAGNKPATPVEIQSSHTPAAATATPTTIPSETVSPAPTIQMTATVTPTPTITPENFGLVGSGFDIANVQVVNVQADTVRIDFKYRLDRDYVRPADQQLFVLLLIPSNCKDEHTNDPRYYLFDAIGTGGFAYKQNAKSRCNLPFFDMTINSQAKDDSTNVHFKELYRERIKQPLELAGNSLVIDASNLTVKNVEFHSTGSWTGQLTFEYAFRADVALVPERYRFALNAGAVVRSCSLGAVGPALTSPEGKYTIEINSTSASDPTCFDNRERFSYEGATIDVEDVLTNSRLFSHAIEFTITLKKEP